MYYSLYASSWVNSELSCFYEKNNCLVINQLDCIQIYNDDLSSIPFFLMNQVKLLESIDILIQNQIQDLLNQIVKKKLLIDSAKTWFLDSIILSVASQE